MRKQILETDHRPTTPPPAAESPSEGAEEGRSLARRYLPDTVRFLAAIAFGKDSEASVYTKALCAREIVAIAGLSPPTPSALPHEGSGGRPE